VETIINEGGSPHGAMPERWAIGVGGKKKTYTSIRSIPGGLWCVGGFWVFVERKKGAW